MTDFAQFHDELRSVARQLLAGSVPGASHGDPAPPLGWDTMADAGWLGLEVPEAQGGAGATFAETALILVELGRAAATSGFFGSGVLAVGALLDAEPGDARDGLLARIAAGRLRATVALDGALMPGTVPAPGGGSVPFRLVGTDAGRRLQGSAGFVFDAAEADVVLVVAEDGDRTALVAVDREALAVEPLPVVDGTRRLASVVADDVVPEAVLGLEADPATALARIGDRAATAIACDSYGAASAMLDATVAYAGQRHQFNRPIGSFQAVKHQCADAMVTLAVARELLDAAVEAVAAGDPGAGRAVAMAKSYVCDGAVDVVGKAMQLHGGIGYTWESGVHVYLKRVALDRAVFGSPASHRRRLDGRDRLDPAYDSERTFI